ncbi:hypothetical protein [Saccharopolyspora pogona]|nr:hypothetical protein [Saccharopolyspora pogona]
MTEPQDLRLPGLGRARGKSVVRALGPFALGGEKHGYRLLSLLGAS